MGGHQRFSHTPVMVREVLEYLRPVDGEVYCDATLGGGGHTAHILQRSEPTGRVIGIDQDSDALHAARSRFGTETDSNRLVIIHGNFGDIDSLLEHYGPVDGFLVDLGVSSHQLDKADRGFSLMRDGLLDMRMDRRIDQTAYDLIGRTTVDGLAGILKRYGDVPFARRVAREMKRAVAENINSTVALAERIKAVVPRKNPRKQSIHPATTVFQALRIAVNGEIDVLENFLAKFPRFLNKGGRIVTLAYHSVEDRAVKRAFRGLAKGPTGPADLYPNEPREATLEILTRKPIRPTESEIEENPRARSARLRAAIKRT